MPNQGLHSFTPMAQNLGDIVVRDETKRAAMEAISRLARQAFAQGRIELAQMKREQAGYFYEAVKRKEVRIPLVSGRRLQRLSPKTFDTGGRFELGCASVIMASCNFAVECRKRDKHCESQRANEDAGAFVLDALDLSFRRHPVRGGRHHLDEIVAGLR